MAIAIHHGAVARDSLSGKVALIEADAILAIIGQEVGDDRGVTLRGVYHLRGAQQVLIEPCGVVRGVATAAA